MLAQAIVREGAKSVAAGSNPMDMKRGIELAVANVVADARGARPIVVASVCGTEADPQVHSAQVSKLEAAGVLVAASNARAAEVALAVSRRQA